MNIITADLETFWSTTHTLSKMNPFDYVMHPETELISASFQLNDGQPVCVFGEDAIRTVVTGIDWNNVWLIGHNMSTFDSLVFAWRLGVKPKLWGCTLAMARPIHAKTVGLSLGKLVEHYGIGKKDSTALVNTRGKKLKDFTDAERRAMAEYNKADARQCFELFKRLRPHFNAKELWHIDAKIRALVEPQLELDVPMLEAALAEEQAHKRAALLALADMLDTRGIIPVGDTPTDEDYLIDRVRATLASAQKFSEVLHHQGVPVPMKPSPTNPANKVPALAKTDEAFQALVNHDDPLVAAAAQARLAVKSTLAETRMQAFIDAARYTGGKWPVTTHYCGADTTGRASGWHYNPLNLPRVPRDKDGNIIPKVTNALRMSIKAPPGYKVVVADLSGIEMRVNHFLWQVPYSTQLWRQDPEADIYKPTAAAFFNVPVEQVDGAMRQVGKVQQLACIAEGSLVLTDKGLVPIEQVTTDHRVWDGVEWVAHDGPIFQGEQEVITYDSLTATPDHIVYLRDGRTCEFGQAARAGLEIARTGDGRTSLRTGGDHRYRGSEAREAPLCTGSLSVVHPGEMDQPGQPATRYNERVPIVQPAAPDTEVARPPTHGGAATMSQPQRSGVPPVRRSGHPVPVRVDPTGGTVGGREPRTSTGHGVGSDRQQRPLCSWESALGAAASEPLQPREIHPSETVGVSGGVSARPIRRQHNDAVPTRGADVRRDRGAVGEAVGQTKRRVWDILNAGPRHRFTVEGRLVSNCGFGCGPDRYVDMARIMGGLTLTRDEAAAQVYSWREMTAEIPSGWRKCQTALSWVYQGIERPIDPWEMVWTCADGFRLPSGRLIRYPALRQEATAKRNPRTGAAEMRDEWVYGQGRHKAFIGGPKADENIVQALARDVVYDVAWDVYRMTGRYPALEVYDELVYVVPEGEAEEHLRIVQERMRQKVEWFPALVTWSEGDIGDRYGECK